MGAENGSEGPDIFRILVDAEPASAVVRAHGELDISTAARLQQALAEAEAMAEIIALDLRGLTFMGAAGLNVIVNAKERLGDRLVVHSPVGQVRRLLEVTRLELLLGPGEPSAQNLELVRLMWTAFANGGAAALSGLVGDRVVWRPLQAGGRVLRGLDELDRFCNGERVQMGRPKGLTPLGTDVLCRFELRPDDGPEREAWSLCLFAGGQLTHAIGFEEREHAVRAHSMLRCP